MRRPALRCAPLVPPEVIAAVAGRCAGRVVGSEADCVVGPIAPGNHRVVPGADGARVERRFHCAGR